MPGMLCTCAAVACPTWYRRSCKGVCYFESHVPRSCHFLECLRQQLFLIHACGNGSQGGKAVFTVSPTAHGLPQRCIHSTKTCRPSGQNGAGSPPCRTGKLSLKKSQSNQQLRANQTIVSRSRIVLDAPGCRVFNWIWGRVADA